MSGLAGRRKAVRIAESSLTHSRALRPDGDLPLVIEPAIEGVNLPLWAERNRAGVDRKLTAHGGILFRGFDLESVEEFERLINAVAGEAMNYSYRSTPRTQVAGKIYTSTEYPQDQAIPLHSEMSYARRWPGKIFFHALRVADEGGETPVADNRRVFEGIDTTVRDMFTERGVMYVRNYGDDLDLPWPEVFQTDTRREVERFCAAQGITVEWRPGERLRTRQVCQAIVSHPLTGEAVWFNQAHLFHISSLPPEVRDSLSSVLEPDDLPRHVCYGDGSPIEESALDAVRQAYDRAQVVFPWEAGDVLLLDNVLVAHGRRPFAGERWVVVGMAEPAGEPDVVRGP